MGLRDIDPEGWLEYRAPAWVRWLFVKLNDFVVWVQRKRRRR